MIYDVVITPEAFEEIAKQVGPVDGLEALEQLLFPPRIDYLNVLVSDPHAEHWWKDVESRVYRLPPQARDRALSLLARINDVVLSHRTSSLKVPKSEDQWIRFSRRRENGHIDWIFASRADPGGDASVVGTDKVRDLEWIRRSLPFQMSVSRSVDGQKRLLQKLCDHSDWCVAQLPYIKGGDSGDEIVTVKQLIRIACGSDRSTRPFALDLLCKPGDERKAIGIRDVLRSMSLSSERLVDVRVYWDEEALDRNFLAGTFQEMSDGTLRRRPRWLVAAQHVAVGKNGDGQKSTWTLRDRTDVEAEHHRLESLIRTIGKPAVHEVIPRSGDAAASVPPNVARP
ncbi:hypothetical protein [Candidatus Laterigemmans baculatus]|uniref:hypothetical protein n=1 Tax=Candidatus Laterigemmans baculatus TaxID=2770505 RepID=UPI0013D98A64|nr:hypothetical protein [Candidatus Laterigemmans baculatus]